MNNPVETTLESERLIFGVVEEASVVDLVLDSIAVETIFVVKDAFCEGVALDHMV